MSRRTTKIRFILLAAVLATAMASTGCAKKFFAERAGKELGESICALIEADNSEEAQQAIDDINDQMESLQGKYELWTGDERSEIDQTVADLQAAIADGDRAEVRQDVIELRRLMGEAQDDTSDVTEAAVDGIKQGLESCRPG